MTVSQLLHSPVRIQSRGFRSELDSLHCVVRRVLIKVKFTRGLPIVTVTENFSITGLTGSCVVSVITSLVKITHFILIIWRFVLIIAICDQAQEDVLSKVYKPQSEYGQECLNYRMKSFASKTIFNRTSRKVTGNVDVWKLENLLGVVTYHSAESGEAPGPGGLQINWDQILKLSFTFSDVSIHRSFPFYFLNFSQSSLFDKCYNRHLSFLLS